MRPSTQKVNLFFCFLYFLSVCWFVLIVFYFVKIKAGCKVPTGMYSVHTENMK